MEFAGFDWDAGNREKCQRHGVSIAEIESLFDREVRIAPALTRLVNEDRFKAIGTTGTGRHVFLVFTFRRRGESVLLRPISARYMHQKEIAHYEKETSSSAE